MNPQDKGDETSTGLMLAAPNVTIATGRQVGWKKLRGDHIRPHRR